jgi:putative tryptophan/tyrosine transport system substrate-binding protein
VTAVDEAVPGRSGIYEELEAAARALGLRLRIVRVSAEMLDATLAREASEPTDALYVVHSGFMFSERAKLFDFAARRRLPAMYGNRLYTEAGGLAAYGTDVLHMYYRVASYIDRILRGASPADMPVERPTKFDFAINLRTAQALVINIPADVLGQATEIIQ